MFVYCLLFLYSLALCDALITLPTIGHLHFCKHFEEFEQLMIQARSENVVIVGVLTFNLSLDAYSSLYLGNILDLFDIPELMVNTVILEKQEGQTMIETGAKMIQLLPPRSIFVSYEHGLSSFGLISLEQMKRLGYGPRVVYHLNHERPWTLSESGDMNFIYRSIDKLIASYQLHPLVLRNYYYEPLLNDSHYIPLGPAFYSYVLGNPDSAFAQSYLIPPSQRTTKCYFKGRLNYFMTLENNSIVHSDSSELHIQQRNQLIALMNNSNSNCIVESSDDKGNMTHNEFYALYVNSLANSVFALCPAGNNPETFRHYEALELGTIPILIRPPPEKDFLKYDLWSTYPGPILSDWSELPDYLNSMNAEQTDALQKTVVSWYKDFKILVKQRVKELLIRTFDEVSNNQAAEQQPKVETTVEGTTVEDLRLLNIWKQMEDLHRRLTIVEVELSASIEREKQLIEILKQAKIIQ